MIASEVSELGWVILATFVVFVLLFLILKNKLGIISLKAGGVEASFDIHETMKKMDEKVDAINLAVNHQPEGAPSLVQRVTYIEAHQGWQNQCLIKIARHVGCHIDQPPQPELQEENLT